MDNLDYHDLQNLFDIFFFGGIIYLNNLMSIDHHW